MNIFVYEFLEDMVEVGYRTWMQLLIVFGVLTWAFSQTSYGVLVLIGWILTLNMVAALGVTVWWDFKGRAEHAY